MIEQMDLKWTHRTETESKGWRHIPDEKSYCWKHWDWVCIESPLHHWTKNSQQVSLCCQCSIWIQPGPWGKSLPGTGLWGSSPEKYWEINFTEILLGKYVYQYLLEIRYLLWISRFILHQHRNTSVVAKKWVETAPPFGLPLTMGFLAKALQIN